MKSSGFRVKKHLHIYEAEVSSWPEIKRNLKKQQKDIFD